MAWRSTTIPWEQRTAEEREALGFAWSTGDLRYKLDASQIVVYDQIRRLFADPAITSSAERFFALDISRQWGKDYLMCLLAIEEALRNPGDRIPYGAMSKDSLKEILAPTFREVIQDCPPELRPSERATGHFIFPNGSVIRMAGVNQEPDLLRGPATRRIFLTEVGFYRHPEYVIDSVATAMLLTREDGWMVMGSTPAETPDHYWSRVIVPNAKAEGKHAHRTIEDNPRISGAQREGFIRKAGGRESTKCRRELFAEHVIEETLALVPEFSAAKATVVAEHPSPPFRRCLVALDVGFSDLSVTLFGYYDFRKAIAVIEAENVHRQKTSGVIDRAAEEKEGELWGEDPGAELYSRVCDAAQITVHDLSMRANEDGLLEHDPERAWLAADKDDADAAHNNLREWVKSERLRIHPRCTTLISHLEHGVWRTDSHGRPTRDYARSGDFGHFDGVAALKYFLRHLDVYTNPFPARWGQPHPNDAWIHEDEDESDAALGGLLTGS